MIFIQGGIYYFQIMDWYSSTFSLMVLSLTECFVISWIYGITPFTACNASCSNHNNMCIS